MEHHHHNHLDAGLRAAAGGGGGPDDAGGMDGMDGGMSMSMAMTFQPFSEYKTKIIWDWWDVQTPAQYAATLVALALAVVFYRYLVRLELSLARATATAGGAAGAAGTGGNMELGETLLAGAGPRAPQSKALGFLRRLPLSRRLAHALLGGLLYAYALLLMLAAMSYNPGVFIALVVGYVAGEFAFAPSLAAGGMAAQVKGPSCCE